MARKKMFAEMDVDKNGTLEIREIKEGLANAGLQDIEKDITALMQELDNDGSGKVDYREFIAATMNKKVALTHDYVWQVFKQFDTDHTGSINKDNLATILSSGHVTKFTQVVGLEKTEIEELMTKYDKDGKLISTAPDGLTKDTAAKTCLDIYKAYKGFRSGTYYLKKGGADNGTPVKVHCDMGDYVNDRPGWTLVVKYGGDRNFNQGFNVGEYQAANLANRVTNNSGKFSDADIIRWQNLHSSRLLRYIGHKSSSEYYFFYTQNKDHCMDNAPSCSKKDCPGNNRYPMRWGKSNPGSNNRAYITGGWASNGGIYGGHDNHGNCHGGMNGCASSWIRGVGHICTWNNKGSAGLWFNYGTWTGGRYRGSTWILGGSLTDGL